jgi:hypothetical protein
MTTIFFAFPYSFDDEYRRILIAACHDLHIGHVFGDGSLSSDALLDKMSSAIEACDHAFFDITGFNPNVMMELGIAYQHKRRLYFMFNEKAHKNSPARKALKERIPVNIRGQDHFSYETLAEFDFGIRNGLRDALGIGKNSLNDIKLKIDRVLAHGPKRLGEIAKSIGDPENSRTSDALLVMRLEEKVRCRGYGMGARWELRRN